jgi:DNA polymerase III epsilon subunit-like protein
MNTGIDIETSGLDVKPMKNIVAFDLETTGLDKTRDQIIQFAAIKFNPMTYEIYDSMNLKIQPVEPYSISISAYIKHGISKESLKDKPFLKDVAPHIVHFFDDCDVLTYNGKFDDDFLSYHIEKLGFKIDFMSKNLYDAFLEERLRNGMHLEDVYARYKGKTMAEAGLSAHDALSDVKATISIFAAQNRVKKVCPIKCYGVDNVVTDLEFAGRMVPCMNIGKYKSVPLEIIQKIDKEYLLWAVNKSNFTQDSKNFIATFIV